jgi:2-oxoisovalerate dehydrogenase E1 component
MNQLVCEITKSSYLTMGKYPVSAVIRIPIGAYGGGGPYHSGSIESTLLTLKGIKIAYPSNAADMKGLMKAAYYDGNPCIMLEHKGLYWSKNPGTELARCVEPDEDYILPFGKANTVLEASEEAQENGESCVVVTYGMGVYWALGAAKEFPGQVEVLDLRSLLPLDEEAVMAAVRKHGIKQFLCRIFGRPYHATMLYFIGWSSCDIRRQECTCGSDEYGIRIRNFTQYR